MQTKQCAFRKSVHCTGLGHFETKLIHSLTEEQAGMTLITAASHAVSFPGGLLDWLCEGSCVFFPCWTAAFGVHRV